MTDLHTNTPDEEARREERHAYLAEIRSAREAYLHQTDEVVRMRAALRLMVLLRRAPDAEASMRGRQQLIVPAWREAAWQRDTARLHAYIGAVPGIANITVRSISRQAHRLALGGPQRPLEDPPGTVIAHLAFVLDAAALMGIREDLSGVVGAEGRPPALWWLDVVAVLDDECEDAHPYAITELINANAPAAPAPLQATAADGPAEYIINDDLRNALQRAAGEVPELAMRIRPHLAAQAADGRLMATVPLMAQSVGSSDVRTATLHIRRVMFAGVRHDDLDPMESLASAVGADLPGALIISAAVRRNEDDWPDVRVVYVDAENLAQLA